MDKYEAISKLKEFNREAEKLFNLTFVKDLPKAGCSIKWERGKGISTELRGPDTEAIKAFCNDLRKFIQPNDTLRIHKLIPIYQSDIINNEEAKETFNESIHDFDVIKNQISVHTYNGEKLTKDKIFNIFLYGSISHRTEETKELHDSWENFEPLYTMLKFEFIMILQEYLRIINNIFYANKLSLKDLRGE